MGFIEDWRNLETLFNSRGLGWALHSIPETLRVPRMPDFPFGLDFEDIFPESYQTFCREIGYPVIGFTYYCQEAFSFLPPDYQHLLTPMVFDEEGEEIVSPTDDGTSPTSAFVMFAGYDLSDIGGFGFARVDGEIVVQAIEYGTVEPDPLGSFEEWIAGQITRLTEFVQDLSDDDIAAMKEENDGETDPHRAVDYALYHDAPHTGFTEDDLKLHWVQDQGGSPYYRYGLVNDDNEWLIPIEQQFKYVAPFRNGQALVCTPEDRYIIDTSGKKIADAPLPPPAFGPNQLDSDGKLFWLAGRADIMGLTNFKNNVARIGGKLAERPLDRLDFIVIGDCEYNPDAKTEADALAEKNPEIQLLTEREFVDQSGFAFPTY